MADVANEEKVPDEEQPVKEKTEEPSSRPSLQRAPSSRRGHLDHLMQRRRASIAVLDQVTEGAVANVSSMPSAIKNLLNESQLDELKCTTTLLKEAGEKLEKFKEHFPQEDKRVEVRMTDFSYRANVDLNESKIPTVYNQSIVYAAWKFIKRRMWNCQKLPEPESILILKNITLNFEPGKMYLILGPPASGKTTLLRAIAGRLSKSNGASVEGSVLYNGLSLKDKHDLHIENIITFVGSLDYHAPRLTVKDTFEFAFQCKSGGTHLPPELVKTDAVRDLVQEFDKDHFRVNTIMKLLGLAHVADTFVGNSEIRGVSGGQRRRVTCGEMAQSNSMPVMCADELSTGLDAASTFDIVNTIMQLSRLNKTTRVLSLLQPSPETVALFDELVLLAEGQVIYAGPVNSVEDHFANLGYAAPDNMDVADFLQVLSTPEGAELFHPPKDSARIDPFTMDELADAYRLSPQFQRIQERQKEPVETSWEKMRSDTLAATPTTVLLKKKYRNNGFRSTWLNLRRNLTIWSRDRRFLIANAIKNVIMGVSVGGVFWQTDSVVSIYGVLFQLNLFIMLGALTAVPEQVNDRIIYYRHADDNFYGALAYALAKGLSLLPQAFTDVVIFGTICYFMVGLEAAVSNFFIYIALLFAFSVAMNQQISIFTSIAANKGGVQALGSCLLLFHLVFSGFIIPPSDIPNYYYWMYWWIPLSWSYRALLLNEFTSPSYSDVVDDAGQTQGDLALIQGGMVWDGEPFGREWIAWAFAYICPFILLCTLLTGLGLVVVRVEPQKSPSPEEGETAKDSVTESKNAAEGDDEAVQEPAAANEGVTETQEKNGEEKVEVGEGCEVDDGAVVGAGSAATGKEELHIPFVPVTVSFSDVCYDVKASTGKDTLRLLNNVNGIFESGRMCALMGSSGAGKTTLMDVIALRKTSGNITGDVRLNGFVQEKIAFRRSSGYVEQFDVQQPELTVRETVLFSARLRLDSSDPDLESDAVKQKFVDHVLRVLELTSLSNCVVGRDGEGGLSFEQRKRVSIAVELSASPSIIFLDEPTSGLDARAALLVVKALRKIADQGRTVVATIHQPSSQVFEMFDDLLLLRKGGYTVFAGELGEESCKLVEYFESRGAQPIDRGENPANWMLTVITSETAGLDYAEEFLASSDFEALKLSIQETIDKRDPTREIKFDNEYAAPASMRRGLMRDRLRTVYWRSPAYNLMRMTISLLIAFILGSIFVTNRNWEITTEQNMTAIINTMFISFIIVGVMSINSVLPVMLELRDNFYRHRAAGMIDYKSLALALGTAEQWFIVVSSALFCVVFIALMGLNGTPGRSFAFWGFFCFNSAIYSYFGQAFVACVPTVPTAMILAAVFIGLNNFFSGLIVRPQYLSGFFEIPYWITPGHYVFEGMVMTMFSGDDSLVLATPGSDFYYEVCPDDSAAGEDCTGTVDDFIDVFFGGRFSRDHVIYDAVILGVFLVLARATTVFGLWYFNYMNT